MAKYMYILSGQHVVLCIGPNAMKRDSFFKVKRKRFSPPTTTCTCRSLTHWKCNCIIIIAGFYW